MLVDLSWQSYFNNGCNGIIPGNYDPDAYIDAQRTSDSLSIFVKMSILSSTSSPLSDSSAGEAYVSIYVSLITALVKY